MSLSIAVLSYSDEFYTTRRLLETGRTLGHQIDTLNPFGLTIQADTSGLRVYEREQIIPPPDAIIPRVGAVLTDWNLLTVETLIRAGSRSPTSASALGMAADKARCATALAQAGVRSVPTYIVREEASMETVLAHMVDQDLVIKLQYGTQGRTVKAIERDTDPRDVIVQWIEQGHPVLIQPWIRMEQPRDLRVMIIDHQAIGAIWRVAKAGEFRSNIHQGGSAHQADLSQDAQAVAEHAAHAIGLAYGAVDLIETNEGFAVLEINGCPGFRSFEETTGFDLATPWLKAVIDG